MWCGVVWCGVVWSDRMFVTIPLTDTERATFRLLARAPLAAAGGALAALALFGACHDSA